MPTSTIDGEFMKPLKKKSTGSPKVLVGPPDNPAGFLFKAVGKGSYNTVYRTAARFAEALIPKFPQFLGPYAFKVPIKAIDGEELFPGLNLPKRAVRLWQSIHASHDHPGAAEYARGSKAGWVAPFFEKSEQASDEEIAKTLVDIYRDTGRIILDAATDGNMLKHKDPKTGEVRIEAVDVDMAMDFKRIASPTSVKHRQAIVEELNQNYFDDVVLQLTKPKTLEITKNLIYLAQSIPYNTSHLQSITYEIIIALSWYREQNIQLAETDIASLPTLLRLLSTNDNHQFSTEIIQNMIYFSQVFAGENIADLEVSEQSIAALTWFRENNKAISKGIYIELTTLVKQNIGLAPPVIEALYGSRTTPLRQTYLEEGFQNNGVSPTMEVSADSAETSAGGTSSSEGMADGGSSSVNPEKPEDLTPPKSPRPFSSIAATIGRFSGLFNPSSFFSEAPSVRTSAMRRLS